jgi:hypothetical protein
MIGACNYGTDIRISASKLAHGVLRNIEGVYGTVAVSLTHFSLDRIGIIALACTCVEDRHKRARMERYEICNARGKRLVIATREEGAASEDHLRIISVSTTA